MNIAFDIDGVFTDLQRFMFDYGCKFFKTGVKNPNVYNVSEVFGALPEAEIDFWNHYGKFYFNKYRVRDFSAQVIKQLRKDGHKVYFITHRNYKAASYCNTTLEKFKKIVEKWFRDAGIPVEQIIYCDASKLPVCLEYNIEVMVEDHPDNIIELASNIKMICFDADYNRHVNGDNIQRCYSMLEAYDLIQKISDIKT